MTEREARDDICAMLWAAWQADAGLAMGAPDLTPMMLWDGLEANAPPPQGEPFARTSVKHVTGAQRSLASDVGTRRFTRGGVVIVQCFGPRTKEGVSIAESLAKVAKDAFEGKASPGGVWFRNARTNEIGPDKGFYQVNAIADFTYDEVK